MLNVAKKPFQFRWILLGVILKVHALYYANELPVRVRLFFTFLCINICKLPQQEETTRKKCSGKSNDAYSLSIRVQTTIIHISHLFFTTISASKNFFQVQSRRELKKALHDTLAWAAWLDSHRKWQIRESDCEISSNCGKIEHSFVKVFL